MLVPFPSTSRFATPNPPLTKCTMHLIQQLGSSEPPVYLPYTEVDAAYALGHSHLNVLHALQTRGGHRISGWSVRHDAVSDQVRAEFYSVWFDLRGILRDVTPGPSGQSAIFFVPDLSLRVTTDGQHDFGYRSLTAENVAEGTKTPAIIDRGPHVAPLLKSLGWPESMSLAEQSARVPDSFDYVVL